MEAVEVAEEVVVGLEEDMEEGLAADTVGGLEEDTVVGLEDIEEVLVEDTVQGLRVMAGMRAAGMGGFQGIGEAALQAMELLRGVTIPVMDGRPTITLWAMRLWWSLMTASRNV
jgi:hypothetical protein